MTPRRRVFLTLLLAVLLAFPLAFAATIWLNWRSNRVVLELPQASELDYKSSGPYSVYVIEGARDWSNLSFPHRYFLVVARAGMKPPDHGHMLDYRFHPDMDTDVESHICKSTAEWEPDGVTFVEATGHRLFIPKKMFLGGR